MIQDQLPKSEGQPAIATSGAGWLKRVVLRVLIFCATAEYRSLWEAKVRTGSAIGKAVMADTEAQRRLETCRNILHGWQHRLHELRNPTTKTVSFWPFDKEETERINGTQNDGGQR